MFEKEKYGFLNTEEYLCRNTAKYNVLTYPISNSSKEYYGALIGIIDMDFFEDILCTSTIESETIICNMAGELLYSSEEWLEIPEEMLELLKQYEEGRKHYQVVIEGKKNRAVLYFSQTTQWYYIRLMENQTLFSCQMKEYIPLAMILVII